MKKTIFIFIMAVAFACSKKDPAPLAVANFTITGDNNFAPNKVTFTSTSTNAQELIWDFGDGKQDQGPTVDHVYTTGKTFTVTLTVTNIEGAKNIISKTVTVKPVPTKMVLNSVLVEQLPLVKPDGSAWDNGSGPDPYFFITDGANLVYASPYFPDVIAANFPLTYTGQGLPKEITSLDATLKITFADYNGTLLSPVNMAFADFKIRSSMPIDGSLYPEKIKFTGSSLSFTLNITWQ
jgi:hypothetical protein